MTETKSAGIQQTIDQKAVIAFLTSREAFHRQAVTRIDTHISHIFLVGDRSYKLKRAIKFDFLDFSTIAKREAACRREVEINTRFAPELYLGVIPVTQTPGGRFALGGEGHIVDWLVEMVRFDGRQQFDILSQTRKLSPEIITRLAETVTGLHKTAPYSLHHGGAQAIQNVAAEIENTLRGAQLDQISQDHLQTWSARFRTEARRRISLMNGRQRHRFIRQCHADLHLANIVLLNDQPTPFDGIEFNDDLCWIDILYDISFPIMDLLFFDERRLANLLLNRYLELTRDYSGLALLPLFMSLRAAIRAMAASMNTEDLPVNKASNYLALASNILSRPKASRLIATSGFSGTGKSTLAKSLAIELVSNAGAIILSSDAIRKRMCGRGLSDRLGPEAYSKTISDKVYRRILIDARRALIAGQTVIADATFLDPAWRHALHALAKDLGVHFTGLWLEAPGNTLKTRLSKRTGDVSDADFAVAEAQIATVKAPDDWQHIDTTGGKAATFTRALDALYGGE